METTNNQVQDTNTKQVSQEVEKQKNAQDLSPIKITLAMKISLVVLGVLLLLVLIVSVFFVPQGDYKTVVRNSPEATTSASALPRIQSEFSKTQQFTTFENTLNTLLAESKGVDLNESALAFPLLEMNVNYTK